MPVILKPFFFDMKNLLLLVFLAVSIVSCGSKEDNKDKVDWKKYKVPSLGKYVYIDKGDILHLQRDCKAVYKEKNAMAVEPVEIKYISFEVLKSVCSVCVPEKEIVKMDSIFSENRKTYCYVGWLYDRLKDKYNDIEDEITFRKELDGRIDLKAVYEDNCNYISLPKTYEEFLEKIGQKKPHKLIDDL